MVEHCRFCYRALDLEFSVNIFKNKQMNPTIPAIVETLTNMKIIESDPFTKLSCFNCFNHLIKFYQFRKNILQINQVVFENKRMNNDSVSGNMGKNWSQITRNNKCNNGDDNNYQKIDGNHHNLIKFNDDQHQSRDNCEMINCFKEEIKIEETYLKTENDDDDEFHKIDESYQHLNVTIFNDDNDYVTNDDNINIDNNNDIDCLDIAEHQSNVKEFPSIIMIDCNKEQEMVEDNSYLNQSIDNKSVTICNDNSVSHFRYEKPHQCNICNKAFKERNRLKLHLMTHTDEKPYQCNICNKKFRINGNLTKHLWIHSDEKPYQCNICKRTFTQKVSLKRHFFLHTGEKPYQCHFCDKKFIQIGSLKQHLRIHTGEQPFQCHICDKKFKQISNLNQHLKMHH